MARRIEFLAPVEAMRGNLSGKQALKYPTKNNSAWEAPSDKRSYATNYNTRYIGSKKSENGLKYFSVRQRSAIMNTPAQRTAQALLGSSKVLADNMLTDITILQRLQVIFREYKKDGINIQPEIYPSDFQSDNFYTCMRKYLMRVLRENMLQPKAAVLTFMPRVGNAINIINPWNKTGGVSGELYNLGDPFLTKFWMQLAPRAMYFYFGTKNNIGLSVLTEAEDESNYDFDEIATGTFVPNTLGITFRTIGTKEYVIYNEFFVKDSTDAYLEKASVPVPDEVYALTSEAPTA